MNKSNIRSIPFKYVGSHLILIPVNINGTLRNMIFDTGIGVTVLSKDLCDELGCPKVDSYSGRRMSGQELTLDISKVDQIQIGDVIQEDAFVSFMDLSKFFPADWGKIDGFISLNFFKNNPFSIDYKNKNIIFESKQSLADLINRGQSVAIEVKSDRYSTTLFTNFTIRSDKKIKVEIDTGSSRLILNSKFMKDLEVEFEGENFKRVDGIDETGNKYSRIFTKMKKSVHLYELPSYSQVEPLVLFQPIIYDGLIGKEYFQNFYTTFDLGESKLVLTKK